MKETKCKLIMNLFYFEEGMKITIRDVLNKYGTYYKYVVSV